MLPSTWQSSEAKIKHLARLRKIRFHLLLVLNLWQFLNHESVRFSLKWTLSTAQKRFKSIEYCKCILHIPAQKKNVLISFFLHTASFLQTTLPIKQSEAKSDGFSHAPNPQNLDRRIQMLVAICQLGPSTRCTNLSSAIVQICQTCRIIEWLAQAFGKCWTRPFVGVGSIWLWCPFFLLANGPFYRIFIQKKQTEKCLKRNEWSTAKTFNHCFNWYYDNNAKNQKIEMLYKSWRSQLQFRVWRQETSILQDCDFQEICLQDLCLSRSTGHES